MGSHMDRGLKVEETSLLESSLGLFFALVVSMQSYVLLSASATYEETMTAISCQREFRGVLYTPCT
jgi:hypothetical protein